MPKRLTNEEFVARVRKNNTHDITILEEYVGRETPILVRCNIHNREYYADTARLAAGSGCPQCAREQAAKSKQKTHEYFIKQVADLNNGITVLGTYSGVRTPIQFQCKYGHIWETTPANILKNCGCPYCSGHMVWRGYNDLWTVRPDIAMLLKNGDDGYHLSKGSSKVVDFICPNCQTIVKKDVATVCRQGLGCPICSDGVSYPNKFIRQVLIQLHINFIPEYSPDWVKPKRYDCYFEHNGAKYIVEMDGAQHFYDGHFGTNSLDTVRVNDELKTSLAIQHSIELIRIDCINSSCEYIREQILSSKLNDILDLSRVDWRLCDIWSQGSFVKDVCDLYRQGIVQTKEISKILYINQATVRKYLKLGRKYGWCDYDVKSSINMENKRKSIPVCLVDDDDNIIYVFNSLRNCVRKMKEMFGIDLHKSCVKQACETHEKYKNFKFKYIDNTQQNDLKEVNTNG